MVVRISYVQVIDSSVRKCFMQYDACRYARVGSIVMLLHDPSDVFLEGAKICNYADWDIPATSLFAALLVSWLILRLVLLPFWVVRSCLCAPLLP